MQDNDFYRGLLFEMKKIGENTTASTSPSKPTAPSSAPSTASPPPLPQQSMPQASPQTPFNFGNVNLDNNQQSWVSNVIGNKPSFQPYINRAEQYTKSLPNLSSFNEGDMEKAMYQTGAENMVNKGVEGYASGGLLGAGKNLLSGVQDSNRVRQSFDTFKKWDPEHQLEAINEVASHDPNLAAFLKSQINRGITEHANSESFGDIAGDVMHGIQGTGSGKPGDLGTSSYTDVLMRDQNVKNFARDAMLGRAGALTGEFLKNNWGKLSAVIGAGGLISLIYSIMKSRQQNMMPINQAQPGPRFL